MSLIEHLQEYASIKTVSLILILVWFVSVCLARIYEDRRIKQLGHRATTLSSYLPWGIDIVFLLSHANIKRNLLQFWQKKLLFNLTVFTTETRLFNQRILFTADQENIKAILAAQFQDFGKGPSMHERWRDFLGDGIFTTDGQQWHDSRQLIRPQFTRDRLGDLHCFESHLQTLLKTIANGGPLEGEGQVVDLKAANGKVLDISDLFFRYTLDITTEFLMGSDVKSLSTLKQDFAEAFNTVQHLQIIYGLMSKAHKLMPKKEYYAGIKVMDNFMNRFIQLALRLSPEELALRTKSDKGYTFLHGLASFTRDPKLIRDQIIAVLLAGRDTTASTLSWAIYELARHPEAVTRLRKEILETVGHDGLPTYEHLKNMPYLKAILNETLRLYPSIPMNVRVALKDTTLPRGGGPDGTQPIGLLKGTLIFYSTLAMQRRKDIYPPSRTHSPTPTSSAQRGGPTGTRSRTTTSLSTQDRASASDSSLP
ncbi:Cytochrome P450 52A12 [Cladobotryum mycophilum]|uniref:Cytochrome P450 52A12 n=1 Tax=Cladobotryum mycophilum TaxID=491253 RepID=A0ABR0S665_9HYPO